MKTYTASAAIAALVVLTPAASAQQPTVITTTHDGAGSLAAGDPRIEELGHYDDYRIRLRAGERVRISVDSEQFDPMVRIYGATDMHEPIAENDDSGDSLNSRLSFGAPEAGEYIVRVLSYEPGAVGAYRLRAEALPPLPAPVTRPTSTSTLTVRIFQGSLAAGDADSDGHHFDDYQITLTQGQTLFVSLESEALDPVVMVLDGRYRDGGNAFAINDDMGETLNSGLVFQAPQSGNYVIRATSFAPGETGAYTLKVAH
ncbi:MAG: hypothetical protein M3N07_04490 [Pseudomonadota bacterium]|nr:hypothetical protein [Pseudomonadota bacterium]